MAYVNKLISPVFVMAFSPVQTIATAVFSYIFQGTSLQWYDLYGAIAIAGGLVALVFAQYSEQKLVSSEQGEGASGLSVNGLTNEGFGVKSHGVASASGGYVSLVAPSGGNSSAVSVVVPLLSSVPDR